MAEDRKRKLSESLANDDDDNNNKIIGNYNENIGTGLNAVAASHGSSSSDDDDDDDFGPSLPSMDKNGNDKSVSSDIGLNSKKYKRSSKGKLAKPSSVSKHTMRLIQHNLPDYPRYTKSYMHRDIITHVVTPPMNGRVMDERVKRFMATGSIDGVVKFWYKSAAPDAVASFASADNKPAFDPNNEWHGDIEFVKEFLAHDNVPVDHMEFSIDGKLLATLSRVDGSIKIFDVVGVDMMNVIDLDIVPHTFTWINDQQNGVQLAVSEFKTGKIFIINPDTEDASKPTAVVANLHRATVLKMAYNPKYDCVISTDENGMIEYWSSNNDNFQRPDTCFALKSKTDLYDLRKNKMWSNQICLSPDGERFLVYSISANQENIRLFEFTSGKLLKKYDESIQAVTEMQQAATAFKVLEETEFSKRLSLEHDLIKNRIDYKTSNDSSTDKYGVVNNSNIIFDETGNFAIYTSILGIKVVNLATNKISLLLGGDESNMRFVNLAIYQGAPKRKQIVTSEMITSENTLIAQSMQRDPVLYATCFEKHRVYLFSKFAGTEQDFMAYVKKDRDVFNDNVVNTDKLTSEQSLLEQQQKYKEEILATESVILHTTLGDITIKLYPAFAPLAVENFVKLCLKEYYNSIIFHRIIKKFMIQTGDPEGDGTGGQSIWGKSFADEFNPNLSHRSPFMVSMANAGPNTNGSQFFITTEPTPWLDGKHTIFGKVISGMETVKRIESVRCDKSDRPEDPPMIMSTSINK